MRYDDCQALWGGPVLTVNFMGIAGVQGPLPLPFTEMILDQKKAKDFGTEAFLNIFNHRLMGLYAKLSRNTTLGHQDIYPHKTAMGQNLGAFLGMGLPTLKNRIAAPDYGLFANASLFWKRPKSAQALRQILEGYFAVPVRIKTFQGTWKKIPRTLQSCLGHEKGKWQCLSKGAALGEQYWDEVARIRLVLGPLSLSSYESFLPGQQAYQALRDIIKFFLLPAWEADLEIILKKEEAPPQKLGRARPLGWLSVLPRPPKNIASVHPLSP